MQKVQKAGRLPSCGGNKILYFYLDPDISNCSPLVVKPDIASPHFNNRNDSGLGFTIYSVDQALCRFE